MNRKASIAQFAFKVPVYILDPEPRSDRTRGSSMPIVLAVSARAHSSTSVAKSARRYRQYRRLRVTGPKSDGKRLRQQHDFSAARQLFGHAIKRRANRAGTRKIRIPHPISTTLGPSSSVSRAACHTKWFFATVIRRRSSSV
jgi:hypothetical protein